MCVSLKSTSVNVMVPLSVKSGFEASSVTAPVASLLVEITGVSFVPVIVTVTGFVSDAPWLSVTVTSKVTVAVCPAARFWKSLPGLYVYTPVVGSMLTLPSP